MTPVRADFPQGACSPPEGSGSDAARLRPMGLIITRKPQGLSFLTLEF